MAPNSDAVPISEGNNLDARTDLTRWRLKVEEGRQTWHYLETDEQLAAWPQSIADKHHLNIITESDVPHSKPAKTELEAVRKAFRYAQATQTEDGHWAGDYGGPLFLMPGWVISCFVTGAMSAITPPMRIEMRRYLFSQIKSRGGWGLHIEGPETMFGTALNYIVLRLIGVPADEPRMIKARNWIHENGGAVGVPAWGKFWLAVLNVYSWDGLNSLAPEVWALPYALPMHPGRYWCHTRQVYLPMSYVYGSRIVAKEDALILSLRKELYPFPYESINWVSARNTCAECDLYSPHTMVCNLLFGALNVYESVHNSAFRKYSLELVAEHVRADDTFTKCLSIGPVSKVINMIVAWHQEGPTSQYFRDHVDRLADYAWMAEDGMKMNGTNGSQLWDTAFMVQAFLESELGHEPEFKQTLQNTLEFLDVCQIKRDVPDHAKYYRHISKGAFPFSTRDCGWIVADCTAEGLKAVLSLQDLKFLNVLVPDDRLFDCVNVLLTMQNDDGGYGSYEATRGPKWLEWLNPAEVFGDIMIEYSYVELTSSVLQGLKAFQQRYPEHRKDEINAVYSRGLTYIQNEQRADGSWYGSWGICFTYGIWFGLEAYALFGEYYDNSDRAKKACEFLMDHQMQDGGWGESFKASETKQWVNHETSQVTQTAWALMALMIARYPHIERLRSAIKLIMSRQQANGSWAQEAITGVFNKSCMISYPNYQIIFPMWALARFAAFEKGIHHEI